MEEETLRHPLCQDNRSTTEKNNHEPKVSVKLIAITDTAVQLRAYAWASNPSTGFDMKCDLLKSIKQRFDVENIALAFAQRVIYIRDSTSDKKTS